MRQIVCVIVVKLTDAKFLFIFSFLFIKSSLLSAAILVNSKKCLKFGTDYDKSWYAVYGYSS